MAKNYYEILGVSKNASEADIKSAFRKLAKEHHPDKGGNEEKFKEINLAYEILSSPEKRAQYDRFGENTSPFQGHQGFGSMDDFIAQQMANMAGGINMNDFFGGRRTRRGQSQRQQTKGQDLRIMINLTLLETLNGVKKNIKVNREEICTSCSGNGSHKGTSFVACKTCSGSGIEVVIQQTPIGIIQSSTTCRGCNGQGRAIGEKCKECHGNGFQTKPETIEIDIPKGALQGHTFTVNKAGNAPRGGNGIYGDLLIQIGLEIKNEDGLTRDGINIFSDVYVSVFDAILGKENFAIQTIDGHAKITIEAGTENGKTYRMKGKGLPDITNKGLFGDHFIYLNIYIPKNINKNEKKFFEEIREEINKHSKDNNFEPNKDNTQHVRGVYGKIMEYVSVHE